MVAILRGRVSETAFINQLDETVAATYAHLDDPPAGPNQDAPTQVAIYELRAQVDRATQLTAGEPPTFDVRGTLLKPTDAAVQPPVPLLDLILLVEEVVDVASQSSVVGTIPRVEVLPSGKDRASAIDALRAGLRTALGESETPKVLLRQVRDILQRVPLR